jgi:SAM-dependent methyltransferase
LTVPPKRNDVGVFSRKQGSSEIDITEFCWKIFPKEPIYEIIVNEARFSLSRLLSILPTYDPATAQVLEVGAGSCILLAYLASKGWQVTGLEPLAPEFNFFSDMQRQVLDYCNRNSISLSILRAKGEELNVPPTFDIVFTINALEHMRDPLLTIDNMYNSLRPGGIALIHCPNYTIPFDSHFNILLVTRLKQVNEWLYRSKISRYPQIWQELNFIRYIDLHRHLVNRGLRFSFNRSVMRDAVGRLFTDPIFAQRMPAAFRYIGASLKYCGVLGAALLLPPRFQTPMEVLIKKDDCTCI